VESIKLAVTATGSPITILLESVLLFNFPNSNEVSKTQQLKAVGLRLASGNLRHYMSIMKCNRSNVAATTKTHYEIAA